MYITHITIIYHSGTRAQIGFKNFRRQNITMRDVIESHRINVLFKTDDQNMKILRYVNSMICIINNTTWSSLVYPGSGRTADAVFSVKEMTS